MEHEYLIEASVWSVGGLFLGYVLGRIERNVLQISMRLDRLSRARRSGRNV